jgi:hypothetical protein
VSISTAIVQAIAILAVLIAISAVVLVYLLRRIRERRRQLDDDLAADREVLKDRAYNSVRLAAAELKVLEQDGLDVSDPRGLVSRAERALAAGDNFHAIQLGRDAQSMLIRLRREGTLPVSAGPDPPAPEPVAPEPADLPREAEPLRLAGGAPARNPAPARFQLSLLREEIDLTEERAPGQPAIVEALRLEAQAEAALANGEDTKALRLALRGRRTLGARVESLPPPTPLAPSAPPATSETLEGTGPSPGPAAPSAAPCPSCGKPGKPGDVFCRYCGSAFGRTRCPRCQAAMDPEDRFCPRCGSPTS